MGHNLISACHRCSRKIFHFRNEEDKTILPFYRKHRNCAKENINNVETIMDNNGHDPIWYCENGYVDDELQEK